MPYSIHGSIKSILSVYADAGTKDQYRGLAKIRAHLAQLTDAFSQQPAILRRPNLEVRWSMGRGRWNVGTRITFRYAQGTAGPLGEPRCYLLCPDGSGIYLVFEGNATIPNHRYARTSITRLLRSSTTDSRKSCRSLERRGFRLDHPADFRSYLDMHDDHGGSIIAHKFYATDEVPDDRVLLGDLEAALRAVDRSLNYEKWEEARNLCAQLLDSRDATVEEETSANLREVTQRVRKAFDPSAEMDESVQLLRMAFTDELLREQKVTQYHRYLKWATLSPKQARRGMNALLNTTAPLSARVNRFLAHLPTDAVSGPGTRLSIASFLLMGLDPDRYPMYKFSPFETVEGVLGWAKPLEDESPGATYVNHRDFARQLLEELREHGLRPRDPHDVQWLIWRLTTSQDPRIALWREENPRASASTDQGLAWVEGPDVIEPLARVLAWVENLRTQQSPDGAFYYKPLLLLAALDLLESDPKHHNRFDFEELFRAFTRRAARRGTSVGEEQFSQPYLRMSNDVNPIRVWNPVTTSGNLDFSRADDPSYVRAVVPCVVIHSAAWPAFASAAGRAEIRRKIRGRWFPVANSQAKGDGVEAERPSRPSGRSEAEANPPTIRETRHDYEGASRTSEAYFYTPAQAQQVLGWPLYISVRGSLPREIVDHRIWYLAAAVDELRKLTPGRRDAQVAPTLRKIHSPTQVETEVRASATVDESRAETEAAQQPNEVRSAGSAGPRGAGGPLVRHEQELLKLLARSGPAREALTTIDESVGEEAFDSLIRCLNRRLRDERDLFTLLFASRSVRGALFGAADPLTDKSLEVITRCSERVEQQVAQGTLHERACMDWALLQDLNRFTPPARTMSELLLRLQHSPTEAYETVEKVDEALKDTTLDSELDQLLGRIDDRHAAVFRQRFLVAPERTLRELGTQLGVSYQRIGQMEERISEQLTYAYYWELPLPRVRTAIQLIREAELFVVEDIFRMLRERGLTDSESTVRDLLAVWRVLGADEESRIAERLLRWRAVGTVASSFPEEILSVARTGLTSEQQDISKAMMNTVRKRAHRSGAVNLQKVLEEVFGRVTPRMADAEAVLSQAGYARASSEYWVGAGGESPVLRKIAEKMLAGCGPLDVHRLREGFERHQARHGHDVPPADVIRAALSRYDTLEVRDDGTVLLKNPDPNLRGLGAWERVWLDLVRENGPVVHYHKILQAYARNGLSKQMAHVLLRNSCLVEKVENLLYCLPGASVSDEDVGRARERSVSENKARTPSPVVAPHSETDWDLVGVPQEFDWPTDDGVSEETFLPEASEVLRSRLRLDAEKGRILVSIPSTDWPGNVSVRILWEGRERVVPSRYLAEENTTFARAVELTASKPPWSRDALIVTESDRRALRLPNPPKGRALVFQPKGGRHALRWRMGEEYYVVIPEAAFSVARADDLFEEWNRLGKPEGWDDHLMLWARTREPVPGGATFSRLGGVDANAVRVFENAARSLGLPAYEQFRRVRARLIGGDRLPSPVSSDEAFAVERPPQLEVSGFWQGTRIVTLSKLGRRNDEFAVQDSISLESSAGAPGIVSLWESGRRPPKQGRYRVEVEGEKPLAFSLLRAPDPSTPFALEVELRLENEDIIVGSDRSGFLERSELESGTLSLRAWPGARINLEVANRPWSRHVVVAADEEGNWSSRWRDLGMGDLPAGPVEVTASWKGLSEARLTFVDGPHITEADLRLEPHAQGTEGPLLSGRFTGPKASLRCKAVLMGSRPWQGQVWSESIEADEDGHFEARLQSAGGARWLMILPEEASSGRCGEKLPLLTKALGEYVPARGYRLSQLSSQRGGRDLGWAAPPAPSAGPAAGAASPGRPLVAQPRIGRLDRKPKGRSVVAGGRSGNARTPLGLDPLRAPSAHRDLRFGPARVG